MVLRLFLGGDGECGCLAVETGDIDRRHLLKVTAVTGTRRPASLRFIRPQLWVALSNGSNMGDREFATRAGVNAAAILVFVNSTIMVAFYMWILQVSIQIMIYLSTVDDMLLVPHLPL